MGSIKAKQIEAAKNNGKIKFRPITAHDFLNKYLTECSENTKSFAFEVTSNNALFALIVPREMLHAIPLFVSSVTDDVRRSVGFLHTDAGKTCLKWRNISVNEARNLAILCGGDLVKLEVRNHATMKRNSTANNEKTIGESFEKEVAKALSGEQIGFKDKMSHKYHSDVLLANGEQIECKARNGFFALNRDVGFNRYKIV